MTRLLWEEPEFVAAFHKFDWKRGKHNEPTLQAEPGLVHAFRQFSGHYPSVKFEVKDPLFLDGVGASVPALCGFSVRVLLPIKFNGEDPDACPKCVRVLSGSDETVFAPRPRLG